MGKANDKTIPNVLLSVKDAATSIGVSTKTLRAFIRTGKIKSVNLGMRMTRISMTELQQLAESNGYHVLFVEKPAETQPSKPETGKGVLANRISSSLDKCSFSVGMVSIRSKKPLGFSCILCSL